MGFVSATVASLEDAEPAAGELREVVVEDLAVESVQRGRTLAPEAHEGLLVVDAGEAVHGIGVLCPPTAPPPCVREVRARRRRIVGRLRTRGWSWEPSAPTSSALQVLRASSCSDLVDSLAGQSELGFQDLVGIVKPVRAQEEGPDETTGPSFRGLADRCWSSGAQRFLWERALAATLLVRADVRPSESIFDAFDATLLLVTRFDDLAIGHTPSPRALGIVYEHHPRK